MANASLATPTTTLWGFPIKLVLDVHGQQLTLEDCIEIDGTQATLNVERVLKHATDECLRQRQ